MMHTLLADNREVLIARCREKVARRASPKPTEEELTHGIPLFLDQLIKTLEIEETAAPGASRSVSGSSDGVGANFSEIGDSAGIHGRELLAQGFTVDQVVHDYGDLCQAVTGLAIEKGVSLGTGEFQTLNRCLDNAIAGAVSAYNFAQSVNVSDAHADVLKQRLGSFAHELRNLLGTATLAVTAMKAGNVGLNGATSAVLDASLVGLRNLADRSLAEVRAAAGMPVQHQLFSLAQFISDVRLSASLEAQVEKCELVVGVVDRRLALEADRELLLSAVGNLLQNAFKFTRRHTEVTLNAYAAGDRILIDIEDHCGGLPKGLAEKMFQPFVQGDEARKGIGLGLSIARRGVEANEGTLSVRDEPGIGCVFTIDLPRHAIPEVIFPSSDYRPVDQKSRT
jgi:signal transduction histidine kinase